MMYNVERVIAMSFPSAGIMAMYRNPIRVCTSRILLECNSLIIDIKRIKEDFSPMFLSSQFNFVAGSCQIFGI